MKCDHQRGTQQEDLHTTHTHSKRICQYTSSVYTCLKRNSYFILLLSYKQSPRLSNNKLCCCLIADQDQNLTKVSQSRDVKYVYFSDI